MLVSRYNLLSPHCHTNRQEIVYFTTYWLLSNFFLSTFYANKLCQVFKLFFFTVFSMMYFYRLNKHIVKTVLWWNDEENWEKYIIKTILVVISFAIQMFDKYFVLTHKFKFDMSEYYQSYLSKILQSTHRIKPYSSSSSCIRRTNMVREYPVSNYCVHVQGFALFFFNNRSAEKNLILALFSYQVAQIHWLWWA